MMRVDTDTAAHIIDVKTQIKPPKSRQKHEMPGASSIVPERYRTFVLLSPHIPARRLGSMSQYHALLGKRVEVQYRAGDVVLPATGTLAADSGKSIFLEENLVQRGQMKSFRWEIPYVCIMSLNETLAPPPALAKDRAPQENTGRNANKAAAGALAHRPNEA